MGSAPEIDSMTRGLAQELKSINEEMNKIRSELYGDHGIGGITKELAKFKSGAFNELLGVNKDDAGNVMDPGGLQGSSSSSSSELGGVDMRRRAREREEAKKDSLSLSEMLVLVFLILLCCYVFSPACRAYVHGLVLFEGEEFDDWY